MIEAPDLLIHTEASPEIGHGHVVRCAALSEEARRRGMSVGFAVEDSYSTDLVVGLGEQITDTPEMPSPYVIRDFREGSSVDAVQRHRRNGSRVLLLDDLSPARTHADIVSDSLMTTDRAARYPHGKDVTYLYGLEYAPLRAEFKRARARPRMGKRAADTRLLISFGGGDHKGITPRFVRALEEAGYRGPATIVVDQVFLSEVTKTVASWHDTLVTIAVPNMADAICDADLVATKLGLTVVESFCLGVGCVLVEPTRAHIELSQLLEANYPGWPAVELGLESEVEFPEAASATSALLEDALTLGELSARGRSLIDGRGTERIIDALVGENG